jgi:hypothetical protein
MRRKGEREKHYIERMEAIYGRMKAAGLSNDEIRDIADYLQEKNPHTYSNVLLRSMSDIVYRNPGNS